jgi:hypothetical protein
MRGGGTRGWTRFEYQTSVPGECGLRGRPDLEYQLFLNGRFHITFCRNWCTDS